MCASPHRVIVVTPFVNSYALPTMSFVKKNPPDSSLLLLGTGFLSLIESNLQLRPPLIGDHLLKATTSPKHQNSPSQITSVGTSLVLSFESDHVMQGLISTTQRSLNLTRYSEYTEKV